MELMVKEKEAKVIPQQQVEITTRIHMDHW